MTLDEADDDLRLLALETAAVLNRAGEVLAECGRQGVRGPDRMGGIDLAGRVTLAWREGRAGARWLRVYADGVRVACGEYRFPKDAPDVGAAVRWVRERLEGKTDG